jgi:Ser/Thr protein kinase RdoA (MazF antagonist)
LMDLERAARFMAACNAVWPLGADERAALPATVRAIWLVVSLRRLSEQADPSPGEVLARLHEARLLSGWAESHAAALEEVAGAVP